MNKSLRNQAITLGLIGLVITGLVFFTLFTGKQYEGSLAQLDILQKSLAEPVLNAKSNYERLAAEADQSVLTSKVLSPLDGVRKLLQDQYDGKGGELSASIDGSESTRVLIKMALVELERTRDLVKVKTPGADFSKSINEIKNIIGHAEQAAKSQRSMLEIISWITVLLVLVVFAGITFWNYRSDKKTLEKTVLGEEKLAQESGRVEMLSGFIEAIASGNYNIELESGKNDELSATLLTMRDKLKTNAEEDQRRNWATSGIAQIGEILRSTNSTSADLYENIVKFVVKYTHSNQGGLFILNDEDSRSPFLELVSCYAFERKKFLKKQLDLGQGLVGQCFQERERIHLREVPQDYVKITSGLGGENPSSCLLVPLNVNEKIYGVLELASFGLYQEFEIQFVEKLAESIASTISTVKVNESTRLLLERTQQQAEEMKSQEEEMRQNMEELSATQEEMQRKEGEYIQRIQDLEGQLGVITR